MIYFITDGEYYKIGYADDVEKRLNNLKTANPRPLKVLATCEGNIQFETKIINMLPGRMGPRTEWFEATPELMELIQDVRERGDVAVKERLARKEAKRNLRPKIDFTEHDKRFRQAIVTCFARLEKQHGQGGLAKILRCSPQSVRNYVRGSSMPLPLILLRLNRSFPETYPELFCIPSSNPALPFTRPNPSKWEQHLKAAQAALGNLIFQAEAA